MAADLFETYAVTVVATMLLAAIFFTGETAVTLMLFAGYRRGLHRRLVIGTFFVKLGGNQNITWALYIWLHLERRDLGCSDRRRDLADAWFRDRLRAFNGVATRPVKHLLLLDGGAGGDRSDHLGDGVLTSTEYRPVRIVAKSSETGDGTNSVQGLAVSMEARALPGVDHFRGILAAYIWGGIFGIGIAATTMLALAGMVVAPDAYGPVTDNAGGIAEMSDLPRTSARRRMPWMPSATPLKAGDQGLCHGSAGLASRCCSRPIPRI